MIIKKRKILSCFTIKQQYPSATYLFLSSKTLDYEADGYTCAFGYGDFPLRTG